MSYIILGEKLSLASQERVRNGAEMQARKRLARKLAIRYAKGYGKTKDAILVKEHLWAPGRG